MRELLHLFSFASSYLKPKHVISEESIVRCVLYHLNMDIILRRQKRRLVATRGYSGGTRRSGWAGAWNNTVNNQKFDTFDLGRIEV